MGKIQLAYSTFGLTNLSFSDALQAVNDAGYEGVEVSFHRRQFNPFKLSDDDLDGFRKQLDTLRVKPACVATASHFFTPSRPHEPSLMTLDVAGRKRRIDLVKRGIQVARKLRVPLVTFGSGFLRDDHVANPSVDPSDILADSIHQCLSEIRSDEDITLLIEPEPGMYIETLEQGLSLLNQVGSPRFQLHIDLCHAYCSEQDYVAALGKAASFARYLHISDARLGYNLKLSIDKEDISIDPHFAKNLVYFPDNADYLLLDNDRPYYFGDTRPSRERTRRIEDLLAAANIKKSLIFIHYPSLYQGPTPFDDEIFTYLISVPNLSYDVLERTAPILAWLRGQPQQLASPIVPVSDMVANTLTGIVHFHEIPGEGSLDFAASFNALTANGFSGYGAVELYHHVDGWQKALRDSYQHLSKFA